MSKLLKILLTLLVLLLLAGGIAGYFAYTYIFAPNVATPPNGKAHELFVPTGSSYDEVLRRLKSGGVLKNDASFALVAERMNYPNKVKPGRYLIKGGISNRDLVNLLRSGKQTPYDLTVNNIRLKEELVGKICSVLEADSATLLQLLGDSTYLAQKGFTPQNVLSVFISDTYRFNWNTSEQQFFDRMLSEYKRYWTPERVSKVQAAGLSPFEAVSLAAIVDEETNKTDEMARIAGVYLNRLEKEWPLQADPTVKYAIGDFSIKRVLTKHTEFQSPYNTYLNTGLPPGPIRIPSKAALNGVVNAERHNYMYFCAREDFSGYHNFAKTLKEHNINARKYQRELNRRNIR